MMKYKFRAWDGKRMWFSGQEGEEDEQGNTFQFYYDREAGSYKASLLGPQFLVATDPYPMYHPGEEVECKLMQYTGGRDKNGVEVWEGDIVKFERDTYLRGGGYRRKTYFSPVKYDNDYCAFLANYIDDEGEELTVTLDKFSLEKIEVVSNIHEDPELLEVSE